MGERRRPLLSVFLWIAAIGWGALLFYFSGQSGLESGELSLRFTRFVLRTFPFLPYSVEVLEPVLRKCAHFGIFGVEGFLLASAMMTTLRERAVGGALAALVCAIVAVLNEYHQSFSDGRSCEVRDMLIDTGGALTGVLFAALVVCLALRFAHRARGRGENVIIS